MKQAISDVDLQIWPCKILLPRASFFVAKPLDFSCRNEPAGCGPGRSASFFFSATTLPPLEQLQSTPASPASPASQHNWRRRAGPGPGPGPGQRSQAKYARSWSYFLCIIYCLLVISTSNTLSHLLSRRLRPIGVHLNKHGYPRFTRPSCARRRCQVPCSKTYEMQRRGLLANNTLGTSF